MDEYITRNNAISAVCLGCNQQFSDEPCEPSDCTIRRSIMALPTADVAPRAEVDRLRELNNSLLEAGQEWQKRYENLAREIFEEIEKYMMDSVDVTHTAYKTIGTSTFAILKKKYTEGQK